MNYFYLQFAIWFTICIKWNRGDYAHKKLALKSMFFKVGVFLNCRVRELVWCVGVVVCGCLLVVSVRLVLVCSRLIVVCGRLMVVCDCLLVVCSRLLVFYDRLLVICGDLWWFVVNACFSNYDLEFHTAEKLQR